MKVVERFEEIQPIIEEKKINVLYFSTDTCNVCKTLRPRIAKLIEQYEKADSYYINTDHVPEAKGSFMVFSVPVIALFYEGKELKRFNRYSSVGEISGFIDRFMEIADV